MCGRSILSRVTAHAEEREMNDEPTPQPKAALPAIACELSALTENQRRRRETLAKALRGCVLEVTDLPSGYAFHLQRLPTTVSLVEELISLERLCCSFLTLATRIDAASDRLVLEMSGGDGVRAFIASQFGDLVAFTPKEAP
jgi:hypothetical protein